MPKTSEARLRAQRKYDTTEGGRAKMRERQQRIRQRNRDFVQDAKTGRGCADCRMNKPLDFHHVVFPKVGEVANMANAYASLARIQAEMDKCVLLCRSCHRTRHATMVS